jgi:hypothetical protein
MPSLDVFFIDGTSMSLNDIKEGDSNSPNVYLIEADGKLYSFPANNVKYFVVHV